MTQLFTELKKGRKVALREGIDFILDPMFKPISPELSEHIDGLYSPFGRKRNNKGPEE
jgi:hypothetical protein